MAKSQASAPLTYEVNCLIEPGADVRLVVVLHGDALVLVVTLEMVGTVRRDVDQGSDAQGCQPETEMPPALGPSLCFRCSV